jgi:hypothetical protein
MKQRKGGGIRLRQHETDQGSIGNMSRNGTAIGTLEACTVSGMTTRFSLGPAKR